MVLEFRGVQSQYVQIPLLGAGLAPPPPLSKGGGGLQPPLHRTKEQANPHLAASGACVCRG